MRGKENYTRKEVWLILGKIERDLLKLCKDNSIMIKEINRYFDNYEL